MNYLFREKLGLEDARSTSELLTRVKKYNNYKEKF